MSEPLLATSKTRRKEPGPRAAQPRLELEGIVKRWPSQASPVLDGIDLRIGPGEGVAIAGRNGAGKTTLLRVAAGLIIAEGGRISVCGCDPERDRTAFQGHIGLLSAGNTGLYGRLRAEHHLELVGGLALMPRRRRRPAIERAVERFQLQPLLGRRVDRLSMGQRQRLRLALSTLHEPQMLMLDEPTTSLDEDGIALLQEFLDELRARGGAFLVCLPTGWTQPLAVDRQLRLDSGRLHVHE